MGTAAAEGLVESLLLDLMPFLRWEELHLWVCVCGEYVQLVELKFQIEY